MDFTENWLNALTDVDLMEDKAGGDVVDCAGEVVLWEVAAPVVDEADDIDAGDNVWVAEDTEDVEDNVAKSVDKYPCCVFVLVFLNVLDVEDATTVSSSTIFVDPTPSTAGSTTP